MKKTILALAAFALVISCEKGKKAEKVETTQVPVENTEVAEKSNDDIAYLYKADNGDIYEVHYLTEQDPKQIEIKVGDASMKLNQTTAWAKGAEYEDDTHLWKTNGDDASFVVDGKETKMTLISPLTYTYKGESENILVTYYSEGEKRFVTVNKDNAEPVTLEQTTAWAKGAEYSNGEVKWVDNGGSAVLEEAGKEASFEKVND